MMVKVWVVLCPGRQRTIMMAGDRTREDAGPSDSTAGVWALAIANSATKETAVNIEVTVIGLILECCQERNVDSQRPGGRGCRNFHFQPVLATRTAKHGWHQGLRGQSQPASVDVYGMGWIGIQTRHSHFYLGRPRTARTIHLECKA